VERGNARLQVQDLDRERLQLVVWHGVHVDRVHQLDRPREHGRDGSEIEQVFATENSEISSDFAVVAGE
jgi:hypothetical protein